MMTLLEKVKANLILQHDEDDPLVQTYITAAVGYAETYQKKPEQYYTDHAMHPTTEQAIILLSSHLYESRDGSTGGFFKDDVQAARQVWDVVNMLLRLNKDWVV